MEEYSVRSAVQRDIPFLINTIVEAEKSNTDKLGLSTLFEKSELEVRELLHSMFDEEIDGCEFSLSSFLIIDFKDKPIAAFGGWIEEFNDELPSSILKSNLISYVFGRDSILNLKSKSHIIKDILIERESNTLQLEYLYVDENHRGKNIPNLLIENLIERSKNLHPKINKVQVQLFKNNFGAMRVYEKNGFSIAKSYKSNNEEILNFLPGDEKILMEKILN